MISILGPTQSELVERRSRRQEMQRAAWQKKRPSLPRFLLSMLSLTRSPWLWGYFAVTVGLDYIVVPVMRARKINVHDALSHTGLYLLEILLTLLLIGLFGWFHMEREYRRERV